MRNILLLFVVALISTGCVINPVNPVPPAPVPPIDPVDPVPPGPTPIPVPPDPIPVPTDRVLTNDEFQSVVDITSSELVARLGEPRPGNRIAQPDGGVAYRYPVSGEDGEYRGKHAYFIFYQGGAFKRKVIF